MMELQGLLNEDSKRNVAAIRARLPKVEIIKPPLEVLNYADLQKVKRGDTIIINGQEEVVVDIRYQLPHNAAPLGLIQIERGGTTQEFYIDKHEILGRILI